eukprot:52889-Prorocentrum_minimum.AAC.3
MQQYSGSQPIQRFPGVSNFIWFRFMHTSKALREFWLTKGRFNSYLAFRCRFRTFRMSEEQEMDREGFLKLAKYPLIKHTDMLEEMRIEAVELCVSAIEKFPTNLEKATQMIKEGMDKKFGAPWHVVIGEGFSFEITYEVGMGKASYLIIYGIIHGRCRETRPGHVGLTGKIDLKVLPKGLPLGGHIVDPRQARDSQE